MHILLLDDMLEFLMITNCQYLAFWNKINWIIIFSYYVPTTDMFITNCIT